MTALPGASPKSSSTPFKPRLLWRGSLHLPDGTALPGIAFISSVPPSFSSSSSSSRSINQDAGDDDASGSSTAFSPSTVTPSSISTPPLTLPKEQQDALGLSIEMVRHAPINIVEVVENVERDEVGNLLKPTSKAGFSSSSTSSSSAAKESFNNKANVNISYQAAGGIRMYVDPAFPSSVAYMERIFCYHERENNDGDEADKEKTDGKEEHHQEVKVVAASSVIVLSLDRSYSYSLNTLHREERDSDDVFSESSPSTRLDSSSSSSFSSSFSQQHSNATTSEAVILGVKVARSHGLSHVELHVGQKVARKVIKKDDAQSHTGQEPRATRSIPFGPRPDDPAPRALSRVLSAKYRSNPQLLPRSASTSSLTSSESRFLSPSLPSAVAKEGANHSSTSTNRPSISSILPSNNNSNNSETRSSSLPVMKRQHSSSSSTSTSTPYPSHQHQSLALPPPPPLHHHRQEKRAKMTTELHDTYQDERKIEEKNRSLIKKLVHHQLLGKGLEKKDADYLSCFNPTCNGTVLALRRHFYTDLIDKNLAVSIIEKHLDMYL